MRPFLHSLIHWVCLSALAIAAHAQQPYSIGAYLQDRRIIRHVDSILNAGDRAGAFALYNTIADPTPWTSYRKAWLAWSAGQPYEALLRKAFDKGYNHVPNVPPDSFEVEHAELLAELQAQTQATRDQHRIQRCLALIERDQVLASGEFDREGNRANVDTLDALIREGGWPSSFPLLNMGVAVTLAHQKWDTRSAFEPYEALIGSECRAGREDWQVALFTLQQRIRHTARNKTDTIRFRGSELSDDDPGLPMVVAISHRLAANGHKQVWIHAADSAIALAIAERVIMVQPINDIPQETLEMLKAMNFDHPASVTMERITIIVDPTLPRDCFLYRMD